MNEISTKVKKMNFIQKIRLNIFKNFFKPSNNMMQKYDNAPEYIKSNEDVLRTVIKGIGEGYITFQDVQNCPKEIFNSLLRKLEIEEKQKIFVQAVNESKYEIIGLLKENHFNDEVICLEALKDSNPKEYYDNVSKIINYLGDYTRTALIIGNPELTKFLNEDIQEKIIGERAERYDESLNGIGEKYLKVFGEQYKIRKVIDAKHCLKYMSVANQIKYFTKKSSIYSDIFQNMSEEAQLKYLETHPDIFQYMSENLQIKLAEKDKWNIIRMKEELQCRMISEDHNNFGYSKFYFAPEGCLCNYTFHCNGFDVQSGLQKLNTNKNNLEKLKVDVRFIKELIEKDNNYIFSYVWYDGNKYDESIQKCKNLFKEMYGVDKLNVFSEKIEEVFVRCQKWDENMAWERTEEHPLSELKILFNPQIIENCNEDTLLEYFERKEQQLDTQEIFRKIIQETYGDKAFEILKARPNLNEYNINSLEIFKPEVLDNFSTEFVNDLISYDIEYFSTEFIQKIIKNPSKLENFKTYYNIISKVMGQNVETMQKAISRFEGVNELLDSVKDKQLSDEQLSNLISVLCSTNSWEYIKTYQDLNNYETLTNEHLKNRLEKFNVVSDDYFRDAVREELFGINTYETNKFLHLFDISEEGLNNVDLEESEKCILFALKFIESSTNINDIKDFINNVIKTQGTKNPIALYSGMQKVKEKQIERFNSQLLTKEQMDEKISELGANLDDKNEKDVSNLPLYKYVDKNKIEHYVLNGIPFGFLSTKINFGTRGFIKEYIKRFLEYDGAKGASTVSYTFIKSNTKSMESIINRYRNGEAGFVFVDPMEQEDILTINAGDAHTTNSVKMVNPWSDGIKSGFRWNYNILNLEEILGTGGVDYNEVAFFRKIRNHLKRNENRKDGRTMPDFYMGDCREPGIVELLKKYNIPVLEVNLEKYPYISQEQQVEENSREEIQR